MEQIPFALEFTDAVVGGPTDHGREDDALIRERPVKIVARGVAKEVGVTSRV